MEITNKLELEINEKGKKWRYIFTEPATKLDPKHCTDYYKVIKENGELGDEVLPRTRLINEIRMSTHPRNTGDGNMISFSITFKNLVENGLRGCDDKELDKFILQCDYPLKKAFNYYSKEDSQNAEKIFLTALEDKIAEVCSGLKSEHESESIVTVLERTLKVERLKESPSLHNAILLQSFRMRQPELEDEPEKI